MGMAKNKDINGFRVISERETMTGSKIILGHSYTSTGHKFVIAEVASLDARSWDSGNYHHHFDAAVAAFKAATLHCKKK